MVEQFIFAEDLVKKRKMKTRLFFLRFFKKFFFKTGRDIFVVSTISGTFLYFLRDTFIYQTFLEDSGVWEIFYSVYGVLYAIIVGFVIVELLSKYEKVSQLFEAEINNLQDLRDMILLLNCSKEKKNRILQSIYNYAKWVVTDEWKLMTNHKVKKIDTTPELYEIYRNLYTVEPEKRLDEIALEIALQKLSDITTNRTDRLVLISQYLPMHLKVLIEIMSIMLILGLLFVNVNHFFIHFIMIFSLIFSILFLRNIINDLDNPFEGMWTLKKSLFEDFCSSVSSKLNIK